MATRLKEIYESMEMILEKGKDSEYKWMICESLKVIFKLLGQQSCYIKFLFYLFIIFIFCIYGTVKSTKVVSEKGVMLERGNFNGQKLQYHEYHASKTRKHIACSTSYQNRFGEAIWFTN